ncbi:hypothetical protein QAD02_000493 [Eretmocerus hayati]|uniref:Uncharacterized protein n=1 Tax=Eretmocerus hayati TaxID=131215 RepID=A0ACC2NDF8_9HYME|nr:hypothetical protein QAD02_000493 [Eretmocerus hayati]
MVYGLPHQSWAGFWPCSRNAHRWFTDCLIKVGQGSGPAQEMLTNGLRTASSKLGRVLALLKKCSQMVYGLPHQSWAGFWPCSRNTGRWLTDCLIIVEQGSGPAQGILADGLRTASS